MDFPGAGFVTEGYEVRNVFRRNLAAYMEAIPNMRRASPPDDVNANCPGCEGSGFWVRGVMNTFDRNEAWNSFNGMNLFDQQQVPGLYPRTAGGPPDTKNDNHLMQPIAMTGNVVAANLLAGYRFRAVRRFPNENLIAAYNKGFQAMGVHPDGMDHWYWNPRLICQVGSAGSMGVSSSMASSGSFQIDSGGQIAGCAIGITGGGIA